MRRLLPALLLTACATYDGGPMAPPGFAAYPEPPNGWEEPERQDRFDAGPDGTAYHLTALPEDGTLRLWSLEDGVSFQFDEGGDFTYDPVANAVVLVEFIPTPGTEVRVTYVERAW